MDLAPAIQGLYAVFARYPAKDKMAGCPCCVSLQDKARLHTAPLRELSAEDLSRFAFKSMSTFGDVDDFRHFLPRMVELLVQGEPASDEWLLQGMSHKYPSA